MSANYWRLSLSVCETKPSVEFQQRDDEDKDEMIEDAD